MTNEQQRAQRIQTEFQKLLTELEKQDEEFAEACARAGVSADELPRVPVPPKWIEQFEACAEERRLALLQSTQCTPAPILRGVFIRA